MDLTPYVDNLRRELATAAAAGGDEARALAERLTAPLESAVRLALLDALSAASAEITRDLAPGSVDLRLRGREASFVVSVPAEPWTEEPPAPVAPEPVPDDSGTARINLRLPEQLKSRVEEAAGRAGVSINAWLVRAAARAVDDEGARRVPPRGPHGSQRYSGWVR
jgi:hypothetical protein